MIAEQAQIWPHPNFGVAPVFYEGEKEDLSWIDARSNCHFKGIEQIYEDLHDKVREFVCLWRCDKGISPGHKVAAVCACVHGRCMLAAFEDQSSCGARIRAHARVW